MTDTNMKDVVARVRAKYPGVYDGIEDATLYGAIVKKYPVYGKSPKTEGLLQKAAKYGGALIPQSGAELGDVPRIAFSSLGGTDLLKGPNGGFTMLGLGKGSPMEQGLDKFGESLEPKTEWGNVMQKQVVEPSLLTVGAMGLKNLLGKGINKLFNVQNARAAMGGNVRAGSGRMGQISEQLGTNAKGAFGKSVQSGGDTGIKFQDVDNWLDNLAREIDISGTTTGTAGTGPAYSNSLGAQVRALKGQWGGLHGNPSHSLETPVLQAHIDWLKNALGQIGPKAQGAFTKVMERGLNATQGGRGLRSAQKGLGNVYQLQEAMQPLTKQSTLAGIAKGSYTPKEIGEFSDVAKYVDPKGNLIESLIKSGKNLAKVTKRNKGAQAIKNLGFYGGGGLYGIDRISKAISGD